MKCVLLQCCAIAYGCTCGNASVERRWNIQRMFSISAVRTNISSVSFKLITSMPSFYFLFSGGLKLPFNLK